MNFIFIRKQTKQMQETLRYSIYTKKMLTMNNVIVKSREKNIIARSSRDAILD